MAEEEELLALFNWPAQREQVLALLETSPMRSGRRRDLYVRWAVGVGAPVTAEDLLRLDPAFTPIPPNR